VLLVTLALNTLLSISQNGINQIPLNKQIGNHLNKDIINASIVLLASMTTKIVKTHKKMARMIANVNAPLKVRG